MPGLHKIFVRLSQHPYETHLSPADGGALVTRRPPSATSHQRRWQRWGEGSCIPLFHGDISLSFHRRTESARTWSPGESISFPESLQILIPRQQSQSSGFTAMGSGFALFINSKAAAAPNTLLAFVVENISLRPRGSSNGQPLAHSENSGVRAGNPLSPVACLLKPWGGGNPANKGKSEGGGALQPQ